MKKIAILLTSGLILIMSCSKDTNTTSNTVVGTWVFTNQITNSFAYPSALTNPFPIGVTNWTTSFDSIKIIFDKTGSYTFLNFNLPVDKGEYRITSDSFIIIKPSTAGFVKFNYSFVSVTFSTGTTSTPAPPYPDFKFSSDTILFKKSTNNKIVFSGKWLTKANNPILPGNDTLILHQSFNYFTKQ